MYTFTNNWFDVSELKHLSHTYINVLSINKILEIGAFEGASSCYFSDNFLDMDGSSLTCVDPFDLMDTTTPLYDGIERRFINNISNSKHYNKIQLSRNYSTDFFNNNINTYTFIYIDGSHLPDAIKQDFENALQCIELNGIIWIDDFASSGIVTDTILKLYEKNRDKLNIVQKCYQIAFRKIK